jgi:hypothetical protein
MKSRRPSAQRLKACAWLENSDAIAADTSSLAAATTPVVGPTAAALASLIIDPILVRSEAADVTISGAAVTNDMLGIPFVGSARDRDTGPYDELGEDVGAC